MAQSRVTMMTMGCRQVKTEYQVRPVEFKMKKFGMIMIEYIKKYHL